MITFQVIVITINSIIVILIAISTVRLVRTKMVIVMIRKLKITFFSSLTAVIDDGSIEDVVLADNDLAAMKEGEIVLRGQKDKKVLSLQAVR